LRAPVIRGSFYVTSPPAPSPYGEGVAKISANGFALILAAALGRLAMALGRLAVSFVRLAIAFGRLAGPFGRLTGPFGRLAGPFGRLPDNINHCPSPYESGQWGQQTYG